MPEDLSRYWVLGEPVVLSHKKPKFSCLSVARKEDVADYALCHRVRHVEDVVSSLVTDKLRMRRLEFIDIVLFVSCRVYQKDVEIVN